MYIVFSVHFIMNVLNSGVNAAQTILLCFLRSIGAWFAQMLFQSSLLDGSMASDNREELCSILKLCSSQLCLRINDLKWAVLHLYISLC